MMIVEILLHKRDAIGERWLAQIFASYNPEMAGYLKRQLNAFANPVGQITAAETGAILDGLCTGADPRNLCGHLEEIIKIRAVQEFSPAEAVSFVFLLKDAIRSEIEAELRDATVLAELHEIETRIDQMVLFAFDIFEKWRQKVYDLRLNEIRAGIVPVAGNQPRRPSCNRPERGEG
jgi:hypothetical protein